MYVMNIRFALPVLLTCIGSISCQAPDAPGSRPAESRATATIGSFHFGGISDFKKQVPGWMKAGAESGIGAAAAVVLIRVEIDEKPAGTFQGTLTAFEMHVFAHSFQKNNTVKGLLTSIHELTHVKQNKNAWGQSAHVLVGSFPVVGASSDEVRKISEKAIAKWFKAFNADYTGRHMGRKINREYQSVFGQNYEGTNPREKEALIDERKFRDQFDNDVVKARAEVRRQSAAITAGKPDPTLSPNRSTPFNLRVEYADPAYNRGDGDWDTTYKTLTLTVDKYGNISGSYGYRKGEITGRLKSPNNAVGQWLEQGGNSDEYRGDFSWNLSSDGKTFTGTWGKGFNKPQNRTWTGTKL